MKPTELESYQSFFSDLHKEVYGVRPRWVSEECWGDIEWLKEEIERLQIELVQVVKEEEDLQKINIEKFEKRVEETINIGAGNRETALRWIFDAAGEDAEDKDYFCFLNFLPYGYFKEVV